MATWTTPSALDDAARSPDPSVCPFFRFERDGALVAPLPAPDDGNRCAAVGAPSPQSLRQQELVCLTAAHADCPRYLRGARATPPGRQLRRPRIPRATVAALLILVLSAGISFGFVVRRGGIDLPVVAGGPSASPGAQVAEASTVPEASSSAAPSEAPTILILDSPSPSARLEPSPPTSAPSVAPSLAPSGTPGPTPSPTARPARTPAPTSDRYLVLTACPDRPRCYIYKVRSGDNLYSIAHWFGVPLSTIYSWNPSYANGAHLRPGDRIRMPPPTR